MKWDFDQLTQRRGTGSYKWDSATDPDVIPLWVADMDFRTAPAVVDALTARAQQGIFGYERVPDAYYEALIQWFSHRHGWQIDPHCVIYTSGVVPAISAIIKALTRPGDGVILPTPAYNCFFSSIRNNGCRTIESKLLASYTDSGIYYTMNFDEIESLASDPANKLLILCNPHNPTGRVWTRPELENLADICRRHRVKVISDEIHCELVHPGYAYTPYGLVDEQAVVCCSPSKAFNIAGLQIANIVCGDAQVRAKIDRAINDNEVCDVGVFGVEALIAAYNGGEDWLNALNEYLYANYLFLRSEFAARAPQLKVCNSESTYLAWIDIAALGIDGEQLEQRALEQQRVWVNGGGMYGDRNFIRINYACPRQRLAEGLNRLFKSITWGGE